MNDIEGIVICGRARGAPPQQPKPQGALRQVGSDARVLATRQVVGFPAMLGGTILRHEDVAR